MSVDLEDLTIGPKASELWTIGAYESVVFEGVGHTFGMNPFYIFSKPEGGFLLVSKDEFFSKDFQKKRIET